MDVFQHMEEALAGLHTAGNYRVFADLERHCSAFPKAAFHNADGT
ncbi:MAG: 5-aminolevulinate synthase, partial [Allorhizobium sp.]